MKARWAVAGIWAVLAVACVGPRVRAADVVEDLVTINVQDAKLSEVATVLSRSASVNVVAASDVKDIKIQLALTNVPLNEVLQVIAETNNLTVRKTASTWIIARGGGSASGPGVVGTGYRPEAPKPVEREVRIVLPPKAERQGNEARPGALVPAAEPAGPRVVDVHPDQRVGVAGSDKVRGPVTRRNIPLRYALPSTIAAMFGQRSVDLTEDGRYIWRRPTRYPGGRPQANVYLGDTINRDDNRLLNNIKSRSLPGLNPQPVPSMGPYGATYAGENIRDQFGGGGNNGGGGFGNNGGGGGFGGGQQGGIFDLPDGITALVGYDLLSALIVVGEPDAIEELQAIINLLDLPPKQIEVEARFVTLSASDADAYGISWSLTDGTSSVTGSTPSTGGATIAFRTATGNFSMLFSSLKRSNQGKIVNAPKVVCQNAQPATVQFTQEIPVVQGGGTVTTSNNVVVPGVNISTMSVTTGLTVVARVTGQPPKESITMTLQPQVQDVVGFVSNPNGGNIPITASQNISTLVRVPNGETIAMGGLVRKNDSTSGTKIPILADLPFIGGLFRNKSQNLDESELLIFLTPTVIREPGITYDVAAATGPPTK